MREGDTIADVDFRIAQVDIAILAGGLTVVLAFRWEGSLFWRLSWWTACGETGQRGHGIPCETTSMYEQLKCRTCDLHWESRTPAHSPLDIQVVLLEPGCGAPAVW